MEGDPGAEGGRVSERFRGAVQGTLNFSGDYTWDLDQHIATRAILGSGLCSLPRDSKLWREVNLEPR